MITKNKLEEIGEEEIRHNFSRGDYIDSTEIEVIKTWLEEKEKERELLKQYERAKLTSAFDAKQDAKKQNKIALAGLILSIIANIIAVIALLKK